jgi:outer membrane receptor for Fe3+-dicitrate
MQFKYEKGYLINVKTNKVFDVSGGKDAEAQKVHMWNRHNGANQRWRIVYVDQFKEQKKGLIEEFGLFANRPFYIRSRLPNRRMAECHNNYDVRQRRWRNNETGQQWVFDPTAKVIRSKKWNNRVLEVQNHSNGLGNMRCYTPTSRWW